jgi:hypothetical protein
LLAGLEDEEGDGWPEDYTALGESPCAVRTLLRRAGRAGVVRPCRKACGCSSSAINTRACGRGSSPTAK